MHLGSEEVVEDPVVSTWVRPPRCSDNSFSNSCALKHNKYKGTTLVCKTDSKTSGQNVCPCSSPEEMVYF